MPKFKKGDRVIRRPNETTVWKGTVVASDWMVVASDWMNVVFVSFDDNHTPVEYPESALEFEDEFLQWISDVQNSERKVE